MPKNNGRAGQGRPYQRKRTGSNGEPVASLSDLGISKKTSMVAQQLAALPA